MELSPISSGSYFSPEFFKFLRVLARNNNREWFSKEQVPLLESRAYPQSPIHQRRSAEMNADRSF